MMFRSGSFCVCVCVCCGLLCGDVCRHSYRNDPQTNAAHGVLLYGLPVVLSLCFINFSRHGVDIRRRYRKGMTHLIQTRYGIFTRARDFGTNLLHTTTTLCTVVATAASALSRCVSPLLFAVGASQKRTPSRGDGVPIVQRPCVLEGQCVLLLLSIAIIGGTTTRRRPTTVRVVVVLHVHPMIPDTASIPSAPDHRLNIRLGSPSRRRGRSGCLSVIAAA